MQPIIYIVGKPYPHPETVEEIKRLGYRLGLFLDQNATAKHPEHYERIVPLDFSGAAALSDQLAAVPDLRVDGLYCLYENYILAKAEIGEFYGLPALSVDSAKICTDKHLMRAAFTAVDPRITPRHSVVTNETELLAFADTAAYPLMLKPANLVKSLLVLRCDDQDELLENYRYAAKTVSQLYRQYNIYGREPQLIVEEFITGRLCSVAAMVDSSGTPHFCEGIVSLASAQEKGKDDTYLYERLLPGTFSPELTERIFETARAGVKALHMTSSAAHIELIYDGLDVKIVEIGARTGGYRNRMYQECYGINLLEQELRLATGEQPHLEGILKKYCSVIELFPDNEGTFKGISGQVDPSEYLFYKIKAKPGRTVGPAKHGYKAAAITMATADDMPHLDDLRRTVDNLTVEVDA